MSEAITGKSPVDSKYRWNNEVPSVLVFDVNETLIDFESMNGLFERIYGDKRAIRAWHAYPRIFFRIARSWIRNRSRSR